MSDWFSDEELDRIARFAAKPGHSRDPTMLLPEDIAEETVEEEDVAETESELKEDEQPEK